MKEYATYQPPTKDQALATIRFYQRELQVYQRLKDQEGVAALQSLLRATSEDLAYARYRERNAADEIQSK